MILIHGAALPSSEYCAQATTSETASLEKVHQTNRLRRGIQIGKPASFRMGAQLSALFAKEEAANHGRGRSAPLQSVYN
jgi:hypothetical protein